MLAVMQAGLVQPCGGDREQTERREALGGTGEALGPQVLWMLQR